MEGLVHCRPKVGLAALVRDKFAVAPGVEVREVQAILLHKSPLDCVVVADAGKPLGLVMRCHMDRLLGTQFGRALYLRRPVRDIMDAAAIVADIGTPLEEIAQLAMARAEPCLYDDLIVTCEGRLSGTVSIPSLLSEMSRAQGALHIAGGVAHELNQPLQVVLGYTEILRQAAEASAFHGSLDTMRSSIERMAAITKRLHDLTADYRTVPYLDGTQIADLRNRTPEDR